MRSRLVHFCDWQSFADARRHRLAPHAHVVINLRRTDLAGLETLQTERGWLRSRTLEGKLSIVADGSSTADRFRALEPTIRAAVIPRGIAVANIRPTRINGRLSARRRLSVPRTAVCVGILEQLTDDESELLANTLLELRSRLGAVCLIGEGAEQPIDRLLAARGLEVIRPRPTSLTELLELMAALDLFVSVSQVGDDRGMRISWATGTPIASTPSDFAHDLLSDGRTAAIAAHHDAPSLTEAAADLLQDEHFRHRCCEQGQTEVQQYAWDKIAAQYLDLYHEALTDRKSQVA